MGTELFDQCIMTAEDYRELSEIERKVLVQKFINLIHYDSEKFKAAVKIINKWENNKKENKND
jgi:hypothetical protein